MYSPRADRPGEQIFYYGSNAAVLTQSGVSLFNSARSGISSFNTFRAGGTTFGERLFMSETFGITSSRFASTGTGGIGSWNEAGSIFKAGWSGAKNGGGMEFRIGLLPSTANPNIARFHLFAPKTFVPYSYTGPAMQLKQSLLRIQNTKPIFPMNF